MNALMVYAGVLVNVIEFDAFKALVLALGLTVLWCTGRKGEDQKPFRAAGVSREIAILYDANTMPATFAADLPQAYPVDSIEPT